MGVAVSGPDGLLQRIASRLPALTRQQRKAAEWIASTYPQVAFASAHTLAAQAGVSVASVVRLGVALGYAGYADMQSAAREGLGGTLLRPGGAESGGSAVEEVLSQDLANLEELRGRLREEEIARAASMVAGAPHIYTLGVRLSHDLSRLLAHQLQWWMGDRVRELDPSPDSLAIALAMLQPGDVLIAFSFPIYTKVALQAAELARERGCKVIGITDSPVAPLVERSDLALIAPVRSRYVFNSYIGPAALIDCLVHAVALSAPEQMDTDTVRRAEENYRRLNMVHQE